MAPQADQSNRFSFGHYESAIPSITEDDMRLPYSAVLKDTGYHEYSLSSIDGHSNYESEYNIL